MLFNFTLEACQFEGRITDVHASRCSPSWGEGRECAHLNHFIVVWAQTHLQWEQNWMEIGITLVFRRAREAVPSAGWKFVTSASSWTINLITMVHCTAGPWDSSINHLEGDGPCGLKCFLIDSLKVCHLNTTKKKRKFQKHL